ILLARPMAAAVAQFAARFSVRALDTTVDASVLWVGAALAMAAAVLLAYVPRLPSAQGAGVGLATGGVRITPGTNRRLRAFATTRIHVHGGRLHARGGRGKAARAFSPRGAELLFGAGRPVHRGPRLHERGSRQEGAARHRQPEHRAAPVRQRRRREPKTVLE